MQNNYNPYQYNSYNQPQQYKQYAFVNGIEGAKAFQVMPNQTMLLMDSDKPIVFMKTSDSLGKATLRYFTLTEMNEEEVIKQYQPKPSIEYVSKADFDSLNEKMNNILSLLEKGKEEVNNG